MYQSQDDFSSPQKHHGDLSLSLSPRSSRHGQEYINEILDRDDQERELAKMYQGGFEKFFSKKSSKRPQRTSIPDVKVNDGSEYYRPNLNLLKKKSKRLQPM